MEKNHFIRTSCLLLCYTLFNIVSSDPFVASDSEPLNINENLYPTVWISHPSYPDEIDPYFFIASLNWFIQSEDGIDDVKSECSVKFDGYAEISLKDVETECRYVGSSEKVTGKIPADKNLSISTSCQSKEGEIEVPKDTLGNVTVRLMVTQMSGENKTFSIIYDVKAVPNESDEEN